MRKEFLATALTFINCGAVLATPHPALAQISEVGPTNELGDVDMNDGTYQLAYRPLEIPEPIEVKTRVHEVVEIQMEKRCDANGRGSFKVKVVPEEGQPSINPWRGALRLKALLTREGQASLERGMVEMKREEDFGKELSLAMNDNQEIVLEENDGVVTSVLKTRPVKHTCIPFLLKRYPVQAVQEEPFFIIISTEQISNPEPEEE